jgi:hypothetical protein
MDTPYNRGTALLRIPPEIVRVNHIGGSLVTLVGNWNQYKFEIFEAETRYRNQTDQTLPELRTTIHTLYDNMPTYLRALIVEDGRVFYSDPMGEKTTMGLNQLREFIVGIQSQYGDGNPLIKEGNE